MPLKTATLKTLIIPSADKNMAVFLENNWENYLTVSSQVEHMHILRPNNLLLDVYTKEKCIFVHEKTCKKMFIKTFIFITWTGNKSHDHQNGMINTFHCIYLMESYMATKMKNRIDESHKHKRKKPNPLPTQKAYILWFHLCKVQN